MILEASGALVVNARGDTEAIVATVLHTKPSDATESDNNYHRRLRRQFKSPVT